MLAQQHAAGFTTPGAGGLTGCAATTASRTPLHGRHRSLRRRGLQDFAASTSTRSYPGSSLSMMSHKILDVAPVQALMLITKWKNEAEHKRALGYDEGTAAAAHHRRCRRHCRRRRHHHQHHQHHHHHRHHHHHHHRRQVMAAQAKERKERESVVRDVMEAVISEVERRQNEEEVVERQEMKVAGDRQWEKERGLAEGSALEGGSTLEAESAIG